MKGIAEEEFLHTPLIMEQRLLSSQHILTHEETTARCRVDYYPLFIYIIFDLQPCLNHPLWTFTYVGGFY